MTDRSLVWTAVLTTAGFQAGLQVISAGLRDLTNVANSVASGISTALSTGLNSIINVVKSIASNISSIIGSALNVLSSTVTSIIGAITGNFSSLLGIISSVGDLISSVLIAPFSILGSVVSGAFDTLTNVAEGALKVLESIATISFEALLAGIAAVTAALGYLTVTGTQAFEKIEASAGRAANQLALRTGEGYGTAKDEIMKITEEISKKSSYTMEDVGSSMISAMLRGIQDNPNAKPEDVANMLLPITQLADITGQNLGDTSNFVNTQLGQWEMGFDKINEVVDKTTIAFGTSRLSFQEYSAIMEQNSIAAKDLGISYDQLSAQVMTLGQSYMPYEKIQSSLRTELQKMPSLVSDLREEYIKMNQDSEKYAETYEKAKQGIGSPGAILLAHGVTPKELDLSRYSIADIAKNLKDIHGLTFEDFKTVFGSGRTGSADAMWTLANNTERFNDNLKNVQNSAGTAGRAATNLTDLLEEAFGRLNAAMSVLAYQFGETLGSRLAGPIYDYVIPAIEYLTNAFDKLFQGDIDGFVNDVIGGFNHLIDMIKNIDWYQIGKDIGYWVGQGVKSLLDIIKGVNWSDAWESLKSAFVQTLEGLRQSIYDITGVDIAQIYNKYRDLFIEIGTAIVTSISNAMIAVGDAIVGVSPIFVSIGSQIIDMAGAVYGALQWALGQDMWDSIVVAAMYGVSVIIGALAALVSELINVGIKAVEIGGKIATSMPSKLANIVTEKYGLPDITQPNWPGELTGISMSPVSMLTSVYNTFTQPTTTTTSTSTSSGGGGGGGSKYNTGLIETVKPIETKDITSDTWHWASKGSSSSGSTSKSSSGSTPTAPAAPAAPATPKGFTAPAAPATPKGFTAPAAPATPATPKGFENAKYWDVSIPETLSGPSGNLINPIEAYKSVQTISFKSMLEAFGLDKKTTNGKTIDQYMDEGVASVQGIKEDFKSTNEYIRNEWRDSRSVIADLPKNFTDSMNSTFPRWETPIKENSKELLANSSAVKSTIENLNSLISTTNENTNATKENTNASKENSAATNQAVKEMSPYSYDTDTGGMFYPSFQGPSSAYRDFAMQNYGYVPKVAMLGSIARQYGGDQDAYFSAMEQLAGKEVTVTVEANTSPAQESISNLVESTQDDLATISVSADTTNAEISVDEAIDKTNTSLATIIIEGNNSGAYGSIDEAVSYGNSQWIEIPIYTYEAGGMSLGDYSSYPGFGSQAGQYTDAWGSGYFYSAPSHAAGLSFVPYDNYLARLHKGERVLTADENQKLSSLMTLTYAPVISIGANVAKEEIRLMLDEQLTRHSNEIEKMIVNKIRGNR